MADNEDFNSSDIEIPDQLDEADNANIGKRAIARIVQGSVEDRISTKITVKTLKDTARAPSTQSHRKYWFKLFNEFARTTLKLGQRPDPTPTAEDYLRFLDILPDLVRGRHPLADGAMAWSTLKSAEYILHSTLTFHYRAWTLSKHDAKRVDALLLKHLQAGRVTKQRTIEKQWITSFLARQMVMAVFRNAIENGTRSWDVVIHKCLSLVLQTATCSRTGDIRQTQGYKQPVHLRWEHVVVKITGTVEEPSIRMLVSIYHRKGHKDDPNEVLRVDLSSIKDDGSSNVVDPTKLLLIYALRLGVVQAKSWAALLRDTLSSPGKTVQWTMPESPVLFGLARRSGHIDLTRAAPANQQLRILREAAELIGMIKRPVTHDLRRGAAQGVVSLSGSFDNDSGARKALGHSSMRRTTDHYLGRGRMTDNWAARLENETGSDPFGPALAVEPYRKEVVASRVIDAMCEERSLDKTNVKHRTQASVLVAAARRQKWEEEQRDVLARPTLSTIPSSGVQPSSDSSKKQKRTFEPGSGHQVSKKANTARTASSIPSPSSGRRPVLQPKSPNGALQRPLSIDHDAQEHENIDPHLRSFTGASVNLGAQAESLIAKKSGQSPRQAHSDSLGDVQTDVGIGDIDYDEEGPLPTETVELGEFFGYPVAGSASSNEETLIDRANEIIGLDQSDASIGDTSILVGDANAFMEYMSRINLVAVHRHNPDLSKYAVEGHSRDAAANFMFACRFSGCTMEKYTEYDRQTHEARCKLNPANAQDPETPETDVDDVQTTSRGRPTRQKKTAVKLMNADGSFATQCPDREQCGQHQIFTNRNTYENHRTRFHSSWPPTQCREAGCTTTCNSRTDYREHLQSVHKFSSEKVNQILDAVQKLPDAVPKGTSSSYVESMCLWPECEDLRQFPTYKQYAKHMYSTHQVTSQQLLSHLPNLDTRKLRELPDLSVTLHHEFPQEGQRCTHSLDCAQVAKLFQTKRAYVQHLMQDHSVPETEAGQHMTGPEIMPFHVTECLFPNCTSRARVYEKDKDYDAHLTRVHGVAARDQTKYYPWSVHNRGVPSAP